MLSRRILLAGALGASTGALTGCSTAAPPTLLPWSSPSALPLPGAASAARRCADLAVLARGLHSRAATWSLNNRQATGLAWFADATTLHARVLASTDPARRLRATTAPAATVDPPATAKATWDELSERLASATAAFRAHALSAEGVPALLWAGLAAFTASVRPVLHTGGFSGGDDGVTKTVELTGDDWRAPMLERAREAVYGIEAVLAAPGLAKGDRDPVRGVLGTWFATRDQLVDQLRADNQVVPVAPVAYRLTMPKDRRQAWALAITIESDLVRQLGAWVANAHTGPERSLAVAQLISTTQAAVWFGAPAWRWPGWPG